MHVLAGLVRPDAGELALGGDSVDVARWSPRAALRAGVAMVHQHSALVPAMTVPENLFFGGPRTGAIFRPARERSRAEALARRFGLEVPLGARVDTLSVGQRQRAEILRALDRGARVLILDEPTAALTPGETVALFPALRRLAEAGRAVIFISHKLAEIEGLADRVSVLRRGRLEGTVSARETSGAELGKMMLGRDLPPLVRATRPRVEASDAAFALRGLEAPGVREASRLRGLDLELAFGEIVGVAGIDGNGQRELEEVLVGVRRPTAGRILVAGRAVAPGVRSLRAAGVAHLSGERERGGLVPGMTITENLALKGSYDDRRFFRGGLWRRSAALATALESVRRFGIEPPDPARDVGTLSGGNAQKVAVARELGSGARVLIACNPTRGLDVGSARFVHEQVLALRAAGGAVLLISTELDEVLGLSDRAVALVRGRFVALPQGADAAAIGAVLLGGANCEAAA
ncbi:MAG: ATP-binding cassette domain-containing protein [Deltaproteobacteria bacterium]|nr:ATP-binding cassette domain-containing protein [Deltaproteobacteria bacterium]